MITAIVVGIVIALTYESITETGRKYKRPLLAEAVICAFLGAVIGFAMTAMAWIF